MLKVTNKQYEIEEPIELTRIDDKGQEVSEYKFTMQITSSELEELKNILFDKENKSDERLIEICFKEHKEEFKEKAGDYKFNEMVETIKGFLLGFFIEKQMKPLDTTITDLTKIMDNFQQLK